jgi:hypothetical protein
MTNSLAARYAYMLTDPDPIVRETARRQLAVRQGANVANVSPHANSSVSAWLHVPLADLFSDAGNPLRYRANGTASCGHEPAHRSRSQSCVVIWPAEGRWWCSACRQGGDAVRAVMSLAGIPYRTALTRLIQRCGAPAGYFRGGVRGLVVEVD